MKRFILFSCLFCCGCAAYMASNKNGIDVAIVQKCNTRSQFLRLGAKLINAEKMVDGSQVEIYQLPKEKGSYVRAMMHGILDISSGFAWELIGTPVEVYLGRDEFIIVKVVYGEDEIVSKMEFIQ